MIVPIDVAKQSLIDRISVALDSEIYMAKLEGVDIANWKLVSKQGIVDIKTWDAFQHSDTTIMIVSDAIYVNGAKSESPWTLYRLVQNPLLDRDDNLTSIGTIFGIPEKHRIVRIKCFCRSGKKGKQWTHDKTKTLVVPSNFKLKALSAAVVQDRQVQIRYQDGNGDGFAETVTSDTTIDNLGIDEIVKLDFLIF